MNRKLALVNISLSILFFISLLAIQTILIGKWNTSLLIQALILDAFIIMGSYGFGAFDISRAFSSTFTVTAIGSIFGICLFGILSIFISNNFSIEVISFSYLYSAVFFPLLQRLFSILYSLITPAKKYLIIGREDEIGHIIDEIKEASKGKFEIYRYINPSPSVLTTEIEEIKAFDEILVGNPKLAAEVAPILTKATENGTKLSQLPQMVESTLKRVPLEIVDMFEDYYNGEFAKAKPTPAKKFFDILFSGLFLILTLPLTAILGVIIYIESGRPVLLKQIRIGCGNKPFGFFKLKSMRNAVKIDEEAENPNAAIEKRVTKIGKVIRKLRLDEIPQFLNVLNGTMSIIGPRPELESYHNSCMKAIPHYESRYRMKPGITGWAQINYCHTSTMEEYKIKTEYDLYYIKNRNLLLDLQIALKTLATMIGMRGSR